jgi:hypothetical protein
VAAKAAISHFFVHWSFFRSGCQKAEFLKIEIEIYGVDIRSKAGSADGLFSN